MRSGHLNLNTTPKRKTSRKTTKKSTSTKKTSNTKKTSSKKQPENKPQPLYKILQKNTANKNVIVYYSGRAVYKGDSTKINFSKEGATIGGVTYKYPKLNLKTY